MNLQPLVRRPHACCTRQIDSYPALLDRLQRARAQTDELFELVTRGFSVRPADSRTAPDHFLPGASGSVRLEPTAAAGSEPAAFDASLDHLFAFGIDPVDGGLPSDQPGDWPALDQVRSYASAIRETLDAELSTDRTAAMNHRLLHTCRSNIA